MEEYFEIPVSQRYTNPVPADSRTGPWPDVATACVEVPEEVRLPGLLVDIQAPGGPVVKWWWPGPGLENADLVEYLPPATPPVSGGGGAGRGTYLNLPGRYSAANTTHTLPAGTKDVDLKWGSGRELEPGTDYQLDTDAAPPTVTIIASLDYYEGERVWGRTYRSSSRTYLALATRYGPGYPPVELPAGTADVAVFWGSGRELEPGIGYTFDDTTRLLTLTANTDTYGGERIWLWLYS